MLRSPRQLISLSVKAADIRAAANLALAQDRTRFLSTLAAKPKAPRYHIVPARSARILYSTKIPVGIDKESEKEVARQKLRADPEAVTSTSTVRGVLAESGRENPSNDEITRGLKSELVRMAMRSHSGAPIDHEKQYRKPSKTRSTSPAFLRSRTSSDLQGRFRTLARRSRRCT